MQGIKAARQWAGRLARDRRGNAMMLIAAAIFPVLALMGSGLDMARAYTVQARLQAACDAASLAGRRAMTNDTIDTAVQNEATKFFNFNFPKGMLQAADVTPVITRPRAGTVSISASTTVPTAVMKIFGYKTLAVSATCDASQDFENVDVVMVLDTTGSMADTMSDGNKKIQALRDAVMAFYDQLKPVQDTLTAAGYRVRYSVVPYSQFANVGKLLYAQNSSYVSLNGPYARLTSYAANGSDYDISWAMKSTTNHDATWANNTWSGCVEERQTVATAGTAPTATELTSMYDLNVDMVPTSDPATKWIAAEMDPNFSESMACPAAAVRLKTWTRSDLLTYVNALNPVGGTYLDVGMMWGARMISSNGVFADSPANYNGMRTFKYVIFLTDGDMDPAPGYYTAYGREAMQRRITGGTVVSPVSKYFATANTMDNTNLQNRHLGRFDTLCQQVRNMPASVWTIKISDSPMDSHLKNCANVGQSATVSQRNALIAQFVAIGQQITELRLSQ